MNKQLLTSKNQNYTIELVDADIIDWFSNDAVTQTDKILDQLNEERFYQPLLDNLQNAVIIDAGANVGLFSLYAHDSAKKIIALEPTPKTFNVLTRLTKNIPQIIPEQIALSDTDGEIDFYINENPTINSLVNAVGEPVKVICNTIASVMSKHNLDWVDFVKCDIEGSEMLAINADTVGAVADRVGTWAVEMHQTNADTGAAWPGNLEHNRRMLSQIFQQYGYQTAAIGVDQLLAWKSQD